MTAPLIDDYQDISPDERDWEEVIGLVQDAYDENAWDYSQTIRAMFREHSTVRVV